MRSFKLFFITLIFSAFWLFSTSVREILEKNVEAVGGAEKISAVRNYSFTIGDFSYYISKEGKMKILRGKKPAYLDVIVVDKNRVRRNAFNKILNLEGAEKISYICQAKLFSGLFTGVEFKEGLEYVGLKKFGIKEFHEMVGKIDEGKVHMYFDPQDFLLKRLVLDYPQEKEKYSINYDFGPYIENDGLKLPSSWFVSKIGARGTLHEIENIKFNESLPEGFFEDLSLNIGDVKILKGELIGNILDFNERQGRLFLITNLTSECFERAELNEGGKFVLKILEKEIELSFYNSLEEARNAGAFQRESFLYKDPSSNFYAINILDPSNLKEILQIPMPIEIKGK
ncbi:MAG: hypothetical protein ACUVUG_08765 [Candidatus Aminicenantia bacterium]